MNLLLVVVVVIATVVGTLLLLVLSLRFLLPWWLRRKLAAAAQMPQQQGIAARISLVPLREPWQQARTEDAIERMRALGFEEAGRFAVPEMPAIRIWAGVHPQDGVAAAVYDHDALPTFFDLVRVYENRATCTVSTNPMQDPDNLPPGNVCIADPDLAPEQALQTLRAQPQTDAPLAITAENFVPVYVELYERSIDYILSRQPPDADKIREIGERMSAATGTEMPQLDDKLMDMAVTLERASRLQALEEAIVDRFLQSGQVAAREWERLRDRVVVVHDLLSREDAAELARSAADEDVAGPLAREVLARALPPIDTFEAISAALPESRRLRLIGEVDHPLYAQIYVAAV